MENFGLCSTYYQGINFYRQIISFLHHGLTQESVSVANGDLDFINLEKEIEAIQHMRSSQLRNILLQDYKIRQDIIQKIIDRNELKQMLTSILSEKQDKLCHEDLKLIAIYFLCVICVCLVIYSFRKFFLKVFRYFMSFFLDKYKLKQKFKLLKLCSKQTGAVMGVYVMLISLIAEVILVWIQSSVFLGWIIPSTWEIRKFLYLGPISLPVASTLTQFTKKQQQGFGGGIATFNPSQPSSSSSKGSWDIDIGSMITLAALKWFIQYCDNKAAQIYVAAQEREEHAQEFSQGLKLD
jgi:hypothetical protein